MSNIAIIPARGGSKRIPRKNIRKFSGKPIISHPIEAAIQSGIFNEVMVSTDDDEIANISKQYGAKVPFLRSPEQSGDMAMVAQVLVEVLNEYEKRGQTFEYACLLYPCAPFVTARRLKEGMELLINSDYCSVLPVVQFSYPPQRGLVIRNENLAMLNPENYNLRSQDLEPIYHDAGQFCCVKSNSLRKEGTFLFERTLALVLPDVEVQDIDTEEDWRAAEIKYQILQRQQK